MHSNSQFSTFILHLSWVQSRASRESSLHCIEPSKMFFRDICLVCHVNVLIAISWNFDYRQDKGREQICIPKAFWLHSAFSRLLVYGPRILVTIVTAPLIQVRFRTLTCETTTTTTTTKWETYLGKVLFCLQTTSAIVTEMFTLLLE